MEDSFLTSRGEKIPFEIMKRDNETVKSIPKMLFPIIKPIVTKRLASPKPYELFNLDSAKRIQKEVNIPVIVVGGIKKIEQIKDIIENNKCEFVSMSRPFIIEPNIVNKFKEGKQSESRCIDCNYCLIGIEKRPLRCYYGKVKK